MDDDNYRRQAVNELIDEYSLNPVLFKTGAIHQLLCKIEDSSSAAKELARLLDGRDFEWVDFDKCIAFCEKYDIQPSAYWFLDKKPQEPETLKDFLETLTIPEIKRLAKQKGIAKLPARKAEIIEKVCAEADLQNFEADVEAALQEREEAYHAAEFRAKCEALVRDVLARASNIRQTKQSAASGLVFRYSISEQSKDDREMAYLMMGGYHTAEDGQGGLKSLPPFFPGDSAWVSADWDRSKKYNKIPCHMRHGILLFFKEKWWSEFFQFFKAFLSSFCIFTDDKANIITTESSDSVREAQGINDRTKGLSKSRKSF